MVRIQQPQHKEVSQDQWVRHHKSTWTFRGIILRGSQLPARHSTAPVVRLPRRRYYQGGGGAKLQDERGTGLAFLSTGAWKKFHFGTSVVASCPTGIAGWLATWNAGFDGHSIAYPNRSRSPAIRTFFELCDARANFHDNTGGFMAQPMFSTNHHCLPNPPMFPEVYVTLISFLRSRA